MVPPRFALPFGVPQKEEAGRVGRPHRLPPRQDVGLDER
jgi:hypothetical protein